MDRRRVSLSYSSMDMYNECHKKAEDIIRSDTGEMNWKPSKPNKSRVPNENPPPLTPGAIDQLKNMDGITVKMSKNND